MYKKALQELIERAARDFFKEKTEYKEVCCYRVELVQGLSAVEFTAHIVACDNDPKYGEHFAVNGYLCYNIEFTRITDINDNEIYKRWN